MIMDSSKVNKTSKTNKEPYIYRTKYAAEASMDDPKNDIRAVALISAKGSIDDIHVSSWN